MKMGYILAEFLILIDMPPSLWNIVQHNVPKGLWFVQFVLWIDDFWLLVNQVCVHRRQGDALKWNNTTVKHGSVWVWVSVAVLITGCETFGLLLLYVTKLGLILRPLVSHDNDPKHASKSTHNSWISSIFSMFASLLVDSLVLKRWKSLHFHFINMQTPTYTVCWIIYCWEKKHWTLS